jgi:hypothetical protein
MSVLAKEKPPTVLCQELVDLVELELLGPAGGPEEVDDLGVNYRYLDAGLVPSETRYLWTEKMMFPGHLGGSFTTSNLSNVDERVCAR